MIKEKNFSRKSKVDNFSKDQLELIVASCDSWRELYRKLGYQSSNYSIKRTILSRLEYYNISTQHFTSSQARQDRNAENTLIENTTAADGTVRRYYLLGNYSPYKCSICDLEPFWNGKELVLTLDHINGNHKDSRPENLRWVCPNCDRQLDTYAGRNHHRYD